MSESPERPAVFRTILTLFFSLLAAVAFLSLDHSPPVGVVITAVLLVVAPFLNRRRTLGPQIVARALWWQAAFLGALIATTSTRMPLGLVMALGGVGALIAAGRSGLSNQTDAFVPVQFRRTLMLSLVLAIADFEALLLYGSIFLEERSVHNMPSLIAFIVAGIAMGISVFGLYRLKVWGLAACLVSNMGVAACAIAGVFDLPTPLVVGLTATAVAQLFLPLPLIRQMVRTRRLA